MRTTRLLAMLVLLLSDGCCPCRDCRDRSTTATRERGSSEAEQRKEGVENHGGMCLACRGPGFAGSSHQEQMGRRCRMHFTNCSNSWPPATAGNAKQQASPSRHTAPASCKPGQVVRCASACVYAKAFRRRHWLGKKTSLAHRLMKEGLQLQENALRRRFDDLPKIRAAKWDQGSP